VRIATEGALWGAIQAHGLLPETVIVSDDAGQFAVGLHGLCWVHAERLVHKLETFTDLQRTAQRRIRALTWWFYADLKVYRREPTRCRRADLRAVRPPLPPPHRLCRPEPAARAAARQQARAVAGARAPRDPAAHEPLGERRPRSRHSAQGQRRNPQQYRTRLPGCVLGPVENLPKTRSAVLGLPRCQARHPRPAYHPLPARPRPNSL
jgi:hypothetical protein